jgi:hypothetical protein
MPVVQVKQGGSRDVGQLREGNVGADAVPSAVYHVDMRFGVPAR